MLRCILCKSYSFKLICQNCQNIFLKPTITKRVVGNDFEVISFYKYSEIETLLKTKHTFIGSFVYKILAVNSFRVFAGEFKSDETIYALSVENRSIGDYSHTAILSKELSSTSIKPVYAKLIAQNSVNYSGKSLEYRKSNPRDFKCFLSGDTDVIIVDDIITTGETILQAKNAIVKEGLNPLFALTLADARDS
jgi:competence protein ComFC